MISRPGVLLLAFFIFSPLYAAQIRIGIVDTGFCPKQLKIPNKNIVVHPTFDATYSVHMNCDKVNESHRRFHGQWVLQTLISSLPTEHQIEIWPVIIFDFEAKQKSSYWTKALAFLEKSRVDVILSAAGLPLAKSKVPNELKLINAKFFVAAGRSGGPIKDNTKLFPHELAPREELYLIGSYYPPLNKDDYLYDEKLLYQDKINYYFTQGPVGDRFVGTSRSVPLALARAIEICPNEFHKKHHSLRECLLKSKKELKASFSNKLMSTF